MDPDDRGYHPEHMWGKREGDNVRVGITDYAQDELGTVV
jgi:glycine cleavage system H protein